MKQLVQWRNNMTYWVEYEYSYKTNGEVYEDCNSGRFHCRKKDIKKEVESKVISELCYEHYSDLKIKINDFYPTTDCEV